MQQSNSAWLARAGKRLPGGVNSPVRAFKGVGGEPLFIARAAGARLYDIEGRSYLDYVGSWGPMIAGHAHPHVVEAVQKAAAGGLSYGAPTTAEVTLAERLCDIVPGLEMLRLVNSGTEATMSAIRLARAVTGRDKIVKFAGCYHGHADSFLVQAGSGALTLGVPSSPGVPRALSELTLVLPYNDSAAAEALFARDGDSLAALIVEPVAGNMNLILPVPGFLETLRALCTRHGVLLIFDEVMTGFRIGLTGAWGEYGVVPDLVTYGKVIGGGLPVGAFGGRAELMREIAPSGPVYQAGTLSGNPLAMAAGHATLDLLTAPGFYAELGAKTQRLTSGLKAAADTAGVPFATATAGGMFGLFFTAEKTVATYDQVMACDLERFKRFFHALLQRGVYLAPSAYEAGFVSQAHTAGDVEQTIDDAREVFAELAA